MILILDEKAAVTGTILFVHGTGVRLADYATGFTQACAQAERAGIGARLVECAWGDPLGVTFEGQSLPDPPDPAAVRTEDEDLARWCWLFDDPLYELTLLTIPDVRTATPAPLPPGRLPSWRQAWNAIAAYHPSYELMLLLQRGGLEPLWRQAWNEIMIQTSVPLLAFERSAHEIPEAAGALARALIAQLHGLAVTSGQAGPERTLRNDLVQRLLRDWNQHVLAPSDFLANLLKRTATGILRRQRYLASNRAAFSIGDVLLYQSRGEEIRSFIRHKIETADGPVTLLAHSLGGIACFELLSGPNPPAVARLITVGSQAPLLYELSALSSLRRPQPLPNGFPPWLNIYDRNDFLSYVASRLFRSAQDVEVPSGQPFPDAHSAYFGNAAVWQEIRGFLP